MTAVVIANISLAACMQKALLFAQAKMEAISATCFAMTAQNSDMKGSAV